MPRLKSQVFFGNVFYVLVTLCLTAALTTATLQAQQARQSEANVVIDESKAKQFASDKYNALYTAFYWLNSVDGKYYKFPEIPPEELVIIDDEPSGITLVHEPLVGVAVRIKVSRDGKFVDVSQPFISTE